MTFTANNFGGIVPSGVGDPLVLARIEETLRQVTEGLQEYEFKRSIDSIMALADYGNIYFQSHEPWRMVKTDKAAAGSVLRSCLQIAKALIIMMQPVMPAKMEAAWGQLGMPERAADQPFAEALIPLAENHSLGRPELLFARMDDAVVKELDETFIGRIRQAEAKEKVKQVQARKISFEEFTSLDIRVGEVEKAEPIKGSEKLLKLIVDIGGDKRQVVAGIAQNHRPEEIVGTQIVLLVNLEPAKLFGVESQAMLLAADAAGGPVLLRPEGRVEPGDKVK
jgi:methionyl-tRNA synthetase